ncbi:hypothetical protein ACHAXS_004108 [Conticribra weissflogii]
MTVRGDMDRALAKQLMVAVVAVVPPVVAAGLLEEESRTRAALARESRTTLFISYAGRRIRRGKGDDEGVAFIVLACSLRTWRGKSKVLAGRQSLFMRSKWRL